MNMAQTKDDHDVENFLQEYLHQLQQQLDQCTTELISQAVSCPKSIPLSLMESPLQEFVRLHHLDLNRRINFQINTFRDHIHEQELCQQLSSYPLTHKQVTVFSSFLLLITSILEKINLTLATDHGTLMSSSSTTIGKL